MTRIAPIAQSNVARVVSGGAEALQQLMQRMSVVGGNLGLDLYQINDARFLGAVERMAASGGRIEVLGDARVAGLATSEPLAKLVQRTHGFFKAYGDGNPRLYQHAKNYHFQTPSGPESWITNLTPIPVNEIRTELSIVTVGAAAEAAQAVSRTALYGTRAQRSGAIDAAAGQGLLVNDPLARRAVLSEGILNVLDHPGANDLLVITKALESKRATRAIIDAHRGGRDVKVYLRDVAAPDAQALVDAGVPAWQVSGKLRPRVNAIFSGDRGVVSSAFLWRSMLAGPERVRTRDMGLLLDGAAGVGVRDAAIAGLAGFDLIPLPKLLKSGPLSAHV